MRIFFASMDHDCFWAMKGESSAKNGHHTGAEVQIAKDNTHRVNRRNYKASRWLKMDAEIGCENMLTEKVKRELEMLRRHIIILKYVVENEPIGILKLAEETGIPSHKVRYSLRVLEQEGLIAASAPGAVTTERTETFIKDLDSAIDQILEMTRELKDVKIER